MAKSYSDQEIVSMLESADERRHNEAILYLHKQHASLVHRFITYNSGSREDAEEILNDVLIIFFRNVRSKQYQLRESKISAYIYATTRRRWLKELKKRNIRPKISGTIEDVQWAETAESNTDSEQDNHDLLQSLMDKLAPKCRQLIRAFLDGYSMEQIAVMMDLKNADSAKAQKYHCLQKLGKLGNQSL